MPLKKGIFKYLIQIILVFFLLSLLVGQSETRALNQPFTGFNP